MRKIITIEKELEFPTMIGEITGISLDQDLKFVDNNNVEGNLYVEGKYKRTEASTMEEEFKFDIPTEISLNEKIDLDSAKIDIDDFSYEIKDDETILCNIKILIEGVEIVDIEEKVEEIEGTKEENRSECDGDYVRKSYDELVNNKEEIKEIEPTENMGSLFTSLGNSEETYATYSVYIMREEDTLEQIMIKYKVTKEDLEDYNELSKITNGSKVIIPVSNE